MLLKIDQLGHDTPSPKMSYGNFCIRYQHTFLRNIYSDNEIAESPQIYTLQNYYLAYQNFIKIYISLLALSRSHINAIDEDQFNDDLKDFLLEKYPETQLEGFGGIKCLNVI